jgi:hypothetical protein
VGSILLRATLADPHLTLTLQMVMGTRHPLTRPERQGNGCIPSEERPSGRNPAAASVLRRRLRGVPMRSSRTFNNGEWSRGVWATRPRSNRPGDSRCSRDLQRRTAALRGFRSGGAEKVGRGMKCPSRQRLARVGGRTWFALSTPTSAGRGRADGGAPKFICGPATDRGVLSTRFLPSRPQPAKRRLFCGLGLWMAPAGLVWTMEAGMPPPYPPPPPLPATTTRLHTRRRVQNSTRPVPRWVPATRRGPAKVQSFQHHCWPLLLRVNKRSPSAWSRVRVPRYSGLMATVKRITTHRCL